MGGWDSHLLGLALNVRVDERDVVVAADDVAQRRQPLLYPLDLDLVGDRVAQVLQFLVGRRGRDEQAFAVAGAGWCQLISAVQGWSDGRERANESL